MLAVVAKVVAKVLADSIMGLSPLIFVLVVLAIIAVLVWIVGARRRG
jgi:hypothetical protein